MFKVLPLTGTHGCCLVLFLLILPFFDASHGVWDMFNVERFSRENLSFTGNILDFGIVIFSHLNIGEPVDLKDNCAKYVAFLRALYLVHQNHHWVTRGSSFYGNHQLFERIYKSAAENADSAAEKVIGLFGEDVLALTEHPKLISTMLDKYTGSFSDPTDLINRSAEAEKDFLQFTKEFYDTIKDSDHMSLGLDDMIMSIANDRETSLYLLQQVYRKVDKMSKLDELAQRFQKKLAQATTTEKAGMLRQKINNNILVNLANRNWGAVGFNSLLVTENENGGMTVNCDFAIPGNSAPFTDKRKYPQGLNQFKQEMMTLISTLAQDMGINNLVQIVHVNGK